MDAEAELQLNSGDKLTEIDLSLLDILRKSDGRTDTVRFAIEVGVDQDALEFQLGSLLEKNCIETISYEDERPTVWYLRIKNTTELARLKAVNNPDNLPIGHYTGRCMSCASDNLWTDYTAYGCNCCGATYFTGDMPPRMVENGTGRDLGAAW